MSAFEVARNRCVTVRERSQNHVFHGGLGISRRKRRNGCIIYDASLTTISSAFFFFCIDAMDIIDLSCSRKNFLTRTSSGSSREERDRSCFFPLLGWKSRSRRLSKCFDLITEGGGRELVGLLVTLESRHTRLPFLLVRKFKETFRSPSKG